VSRKKEGHPDPQPVVLAPEEQKRLNAAWERALDCVAKLCMEQVALSPPVLVENAQALAWIELDSRRIVLDRARIRELGIEGAFDGILAHEILHHVAHPRLISRAAELELLGRAAIPCFTPMLVNLFYDLLINTELGRENSPLSASMSSIMDALLVGADQGSVFEHYCRLVFAGCDWNHELLVGEETEKARAQVQVFWGLSSDHDRFLYFLGVMLPFLLKQSGEAGADGVPSWLKDLGEISPADLPEGLVPSAEGRRALARAREKGWIPKDPQAAGLPPSGPTLEDLIRAHPGLGGKEQAIQAAVGRYRKQVERILDELALIKARIRGVETYPGALEELGGVNAWLDDPGRVDVLASLMAGGELGLLNPLARDEWREAVDRPGIEEVPRMEIYLDTSGSMPNPLHGMNGMTLAALVLAVLAIRRGAVVRGVIYSSTYMTSPWFRDEERALAWFLNFYGGGTVFPWDFLDASCGEDSGLLRVVISDGDFIWNLRARGKGLGAAVKRSLRFALLLHGVVEKQLKESHPDGSAGGWLVTVKDPGQFGMLAAQLAEILIPEKERA